MTPRLPAELKSETVPVQIFQESTFTLADPSDFRLRVNLDAPLPLGYAEAVRRALQLRAQGVHWSYPVIAVVMGEYHGFHRSASWWSTTLKRRGAARRPRGAQIHEQPWNRNRVAA